MSAEKIKLYIIFILLNFLVTYNLNYASEPDTLWTRKFHLDGTETFQSVKQTPDSGFICCGSHVSFTGDYTYNVLLVKYDKYGNLLWSRDIGKKGVSETAEDLLVMKNHDNDLLIVGTSDEGIEGLDMMVMRMDSEGNLIWKRLFDFGNRDLAISVTQTSENTFMIAGISHVSVGNEDISLININSQGDTLWTERYDLGYGYTENTYKVIQTKDSAFVCTGYILFPREAPWGELFILKVDKNGNMLWSKIYGGKNTEYGHDIVENNLGELYITGFYTTSENSDMWLLKTDAKGDTLWTRKYDWGDNDIGEAITLLQNGNIIIGGRSHTEEGFEDIRVTELNRYGEILWSQLYGDYNWDQVFSIERTSEPGFVLSGIYTLNGSRSWDGLVMRFVTDDINDLKDEEIIANYFLSQNYPNPFNPSTTIQFTIPFVETTRRVVSTKLVVYDILGQKVKTLLNKKLSPGSYEVEFDGSKLPSGVYFYRLTNENYSATKKMLLLR